MKSDRAVIRALFKELISSRRRKFPARGLQLDAPNRQGVYVIYSPGKKVVHVGRTVRRERETRHRRPPQGLCRRLRNHLQAASSFTNTFLKGHGARLRRGY